MHSVVRTTVCILSVLVQSLYGNCWYMCSAQSENFAQSRDCVAHSQNPEIVHYSCAFSILHNTLAQSQDLCAISRSRNYSAQSFTPMRMCRNHLMVTREATKMATLCSVDSLR